MYPRIVSLLPAASEIVCALGLEQHLIGRSHECDFPETVKTLPACTQANINASLSSGAIDGQVKALLENALSLYSVDRELIKSLAPDIIITQAQCEVCAVSITEVGAALQGYLEKDVKIISLAPQSVNDVLNDIRIVASACNVPDRGETLCEELQERIDIISHKLKYLDSRPKVACIEWMEPLMTSGNWIPGMTAIAGGLPVLAEAEKHSAYISWDAVLNENPDILILMPCGFPIARTLNEIDLVLHQPGFGSLNAVRNKRVYVADGNQYFNRPGPRLVDSLEILAEIIHPKQFIFGHEGTGWIRFEV